MIAAAVTPDAEEKTRSVKRGANQKRLKELTGKRNHPGMRVAKNQNQSTQMIRRLRLGKMDPM